MEDRNWIDVPELVGFNITSRCNLKCSYCFEDVSRQVAEDASLDEVLSVLKQVDTLGVPEILLEGGEIFAAPFIEELLPKLRDYHFRTHIITNGTLMTEKTADAVADLNISIGVSIDGPTPEHNAFRGATAFHKAISTVELLVAKGATTYVNCTVTKSNANALGQLAELSHNLGVYGLVFQQLHCGGRADASFYKENYLALSQQQALKDLLPALRAKYPDIYFVESEVLDFLNVPERFTKVCNPEFVYKPKKVFRCAAGRRFCLIQSNLDVIPCGILGDFPCGNLRDQPFEDIWRHGEGFSFIRRISELRVDHIPGCKDCIHNPICDGGCRGDMFNYAGDWFATHIFCPFAKEDTRDRVFVHTSDR